MKGFGTTERKNPKGRDTSLEPARKLLGLLVLLAVSAGSGALVGAAHKAQSGTLNHEAEEPASYRVALESPPAFVAGGLVVEEAAPRAVSRAQPIAKVITRRIVRSQAQNAARGAAPVNLPAISSPAVVCDRLDDAKINWLLGLVAQTRASNPQLSEVASRVDQHLKSALGKNMCAEEAQVHVAAMCQDPAVVNLMNQMVRELPIFIRPLVGDPCKADLVAAANKWLH